MWLQEVPEHDTPTQRWKTAWAGWVREAGSGVTLALPLTRSLVIGDHDPAPPLSVVVTTALQVNGRYVRLRMAVAPVLGPIAIGTLLPPATVFELPPPPAAQPPPELLRAGILSIYTDGSGEADGGWGVVVVHGGRGTQTDATARHRATFYGPITLLPTAPPFLGAERGTNNVAELTAFAEALVYLRDVEGSTAPAIIRPDSTYARDVTLGAVTVSANCSLARRVRQLWLHEVARRGGQLWALHVKAHSSNKWNSAADRAAARGALGEARGVGARWADWPPLPPRNPRAHEVSESVRVLRATHVFGVLAIPVPVGVHLTPPDQIEVCTRAILLRLSQDTGPHAPQAINRVRAARTLLLDASRQRAEALRLIREGLQPTTRVLTCPVNVAAMRRYIREAGPDADAPRADGLGTLRERARDFLRALGHNTVVRITYHHCRLGAALVAAGFICAAREYARRGDVDPFRLPRALREVAFAGRGHDLDDSASYPRACLDVFQSGREQSRLFLTHREQVLAEVGLFFLGPHVSAPVRRKAAKDLFNALDNDGSLEAWERRQGCPAMMQMPPFAVGTDGEVFSLRAYQDSRRALTGEFTRRMPTLVTFVRAWLALHKPDNEHKFALTAKSFFLQEAEGLSRAAKLAWSRLRGAGEITSLQHDGVVMVLSQGVTPTDACAALTEVCTAALGYAQPVEEKPFHFDPGDSEDDQDSVADVDAP